MEAEIQAYVDQKDVQSFVKTMEESVEDDKKVKALMGLENRLGQGFDKQYQQLILRAKLSFFNLLPRKANGVAQSTCSLLVSDNVDNFIWFEVPLILFRTPLLCDVLSRGRHIIPLL
ncbi:hypothetical protein GBA52_001013 [Prunus armeniaca]|nr:hypothetical protein GBA52_001013 [Prunus armeniaca]